MTVRSAATAAVKCRWGGAACSRTYHRMTRIQTATARTGNAQGQEGSDERAAPPDRDPADVPPGHWNVVKEPQRMAMLRSLAERVKEENTDG